MNDGDTDRFTGTWELIPELSIYASGDLPKSGRYVISYSSPGVLQIEVAWRMAADTSDNNTKFGGPADGSHIELPKAHGAPDSFSLTRVDQHTLDSAAYRGEERVGLARRTVSHDGAMMSVMQEHTLATGQHIRNFQVYRRLSR